MALTNAVERQESIVKVTITDDDFVSRIHPNMQTVQDLIFTLVLESSSNKQAIMLVTTHFADYEGVPHSDGVILEFDTNNLGNGIGSKTIEDIADAVCELLNKLY